MITFNLKKQWYEKILSGEKTIEYREAKDYWTIRLSNAYMASTDNSEVLHNDMFNYLMEEKIEIVDGKNTDLAIDKPVYAIYLGKEQIDIEKNRKRADGIGANLDGSLCGIKEK